MQKNTLFTLLILICSISAEPYQPNYGWEDSDADIEMPEQGIINPHINLNEPHTEPMVPKWSLGFWQSYWGADEVGYGNQEPFLDHAKALRGMDNQYGDHKHPADVMVLDMFWNGKNWGWDGDLSNMQWDYTRFPDPEGMIDELHEMGFKLVLNYHSGGFGSEWLAKMKEHLEWGADVMWLDFWDGGSNYETQVWNLMGEVWGENKRKIFMARHYQRPNRFNYESPEEWGDMGELKAPNEDEIEKTMPMHWTGDNDGSWGGFQEAIDAVVYSEDGAMDGWSYTHADCPGHIGEPSPELANRWIQHADFSPFTRNHGAGSDRDVWTWGDKMEENSQFSRMLRYKLLPYIYTYVWHIYEDAMPLTRPFKLAFPGQRDDIRYSYMFGEELLVAPVYMPRKELTDDKMPVWLPEGEEWVDYWSHTIVEGGTSVNYDVSEENDKYIPLFVKRGAIIPTGPEMWHIDTEVHPDPLTLDIYPLQSGTSQFIMHDDDGESNDYKKGKYSKTLFKVHKEAEAITVTVGESDGEYTGKPTERDYIVKVNLLDTSYSEVTLNDTQLKHSSDYTSLLGEDGAVDTWAIDEKSNSLYVRFQTSLDVNNSVVITAGELDIVDEISSEENDSSIDGESSEGDITSSASVDGSSASSDGEVSSGDLLSSSIENFISPLFSSLDKKGRHHSVVSLYSDVVMNIESDFSIVEMYSLTGERVVSASVDKGELLLNDLSQYVGVAYVVVRTK